MTTTADHQPTTLAAPAHQDDTSQPVLPEWVRDREQLAAVAGKTTKRAAYKTTRHVVRAPLYLAKLAAWSPRGLGRCVVRLAKWLHDWDSAELRHGHAGSRETAEYSKIHAIRRANLKARAMVFGTVALLVVAPVLALVAPHVLSGLIGVAAGIWLIKLVPGRSLVEVVVGVAVAGAIFWWLPGVLVAIPAPPWWALAAAGVALVVALGFIGKPRGKPITGNTTLPAGMVEPLRAPMVTAALCTLGNAKMKEPEDIRLLTDPHRCGPGVQLDLELPAGVPASFVVKQREAFAAALRRELGCVWPSVGPRHPGHLVTFVSDEPMSKARQKAWPLLKSGEVDIFEPQPAFTTQRGDWRNITLAYSSMVIGAVPRMGKTFVVRELLLIAGLDKRVKVYALDGKGTGDLSPCRLFAHFYSVGDEPEELARVLHALRELREEMRRRTKVIRDLDREVARENKVTSTLANRPGLAPVVVGVDETQVYFLDAPKVVREELVKLVTDLVKRGPALGIQVICATQNVTADTLPSSIADNAVLRFCLKIEGQNQNNRVLGVGARDRGIDAGMFDIDDKGVGYLKAEGRDAEICRSVYGLDAVEAEKVALRARRIREAAGRLTGEAADEEAENEEQQATLLDDVREVMDEAGVDRAHLGVLADRLADLRPVYEHLDSDALGAQLRAAGVPTGQVKVDGRNTTGVRREHLDIAATADADPDETGGTVVPIR